MPTLTRTPVLADRLVGSRAITDVALVVGGTTFVALLAQVIVPLYPVPVTGQTLAVLLVGLTLGARRAGLALLLYLALALFGVPVLAGGHGGPAMLVDPSFGYVIGFVPAAWVIGAFAERRWDRTLLRTGVAALVGTVIPFLVGVPWLAVALARLGPSVWHGQLGAASVAQAAFETGVVPFIVGGLVKALIAAGAMPLLWRLTGRRER